MNNVNFDYKSLPPFKWFILENFPFVEYDFDALTNWQLFCKLGGEMNKIIENLNLTGEQIENLTNAFNALKSYVNNYFENLDVQEEVNNKLDDMAESGELAEIISTYLYYNIILPYDTVSDMKTADNLTDGSIVRTFGFYESGDGGSALYKIITHTDETINERDIIAITGTQLIAVLQIEDQTINIKQLGAKGNGTDDDTDVLNYAFGLSSDVVKKIYLNETYLISSPLLISSNKDIIGIKNNLQYNEDYQPLIITEDDIKMINIAGNSNITLQNFSLKHPLENTNPVVDFTGCRYIDFINIQCYNGNSGNMPSSSNIAFNDTLTEDDSVWSGYIHFNNVRASNYKISVKSQATLIDFKHCVFNRANDFNIHFLGEVMGIENCDISYCTSGIAIKTESKYDLNVINSYFEGIYEDKCVLTTKNINVNLQGCKLWIAEGAQASSALKLELEGDYVKPFRNTLNNYQDGLVSNGNLLPNGNFQKGTFGYTTTTSGSGTVSVKTASQMSAIGIPHYIQNAIEINNGTASHDFVEKLNQGDYLTLGFWIYCDPQTATSPYIFISNTSDSDKMMQIRPVNYGKWYYHVIFGKVTPELASANGWRFKISCSSKTYITGISIMKGLGASLTGQMAPSEDKILTDKLVIKGTNGNYYKLNYNGSSLSWTQVTTI